MWTPCVVGINELWVESVYEPIGAEIEKTKNETWVIKTALFNASKPYSNNSYHPEIKLDGYTEIQLGSSNTETLCFAIFWLLVLVSSTSPMKPLIYGTALLFCIANIMAGVSIYLQILNTLAVGGDLLRVLKSGFVFVPNLPPSWWLTVLKPLQGAMFYFSALVVPVVLWFSLCKESILMGKDQYKVFKVFDS